MPTSHYKSIPHVMDAVLALKPKSVLEIGIGMGKYGMLCREYLDIWGKYFEPWGKYHHKIDGIEVHEQYLNAVSRAVYDCIFIGDARKVLPKIGEYDLILMVDVLEHFTPEDGTALLVECLRHAPGVVVCLPSSFGRTVEVWDNPHEIHRSGGDSFSFSEIGNAHINHQGDYMVVTLTRAINASA